MCNVTAGMPFSAGTNIKSGVIEVAMRCRDCSHEWHFDMPVSEPMDVGTSRGLRHAAEKLIHH